MKVMVATNALDLALRATNSAPLSVKWFGASMDGATDDSAALTAACLLGSGREIYIPKGTLFVKPTNNVNGGSFRLTSRVIIRGEGQESVIRLHPQSGNYNSLFGAASVTSQITNVTFKDLVFDCSAASDTNATPEVAPDKYRFVFWSHNGSDIRFENVIFRNYGGVNAIHIQNTNTVAPGIVIRNCRFEFVRRADQAPYDNSCIYIHTKGPAVVDGCEFYSANQTASTNYYGAGAIELHEGSGQIINNRIQGYRVGIYHTTSASLSATDDTNSTVVIGNNSIKEALRGIELWAWYPHWLKNVSVVGNSISLGNVVKNTTGEWTTLGIGLMIDVSTSPRVWGQARNVNITGNTIYFEDEVANGVTNNFTGPWYVAGISLAACPDAASPTVTNYVQGVNVANNLVVNSPGAGISVFSAYPQEAVSWDGMAITGNTIVNPGSSLDTAGCTDTNTWSGFYLNGIFRGATIVANNVTEQRETANAASPWYAAFRSGSTRVAMTGNYFWRRDTSIPWTRVVTPSNYDNNVFMDAVTFDYDGDSAVVQSGTPITGGVAKTLTAQGGDAMPTWTNRVGGNLLLKGGRSTGSGYSGVVLQAAPTGSSGTNLNEVVSVVTATGDNITFHTNAIFNQSIRGYGSITYDGGIRSMNSTLSAGAYSNNSGGIVLYGQTNGTTYIQWKAGNTEATRWVLGRDTAETGVRNTGSDFFLYGYNDAGGWNGKAIGVSRSSLEVSFDGSLYAVGKLTARTSPTTLGSGSGGSHYTWITTQTNSIGSIGFKAGPGEASRWVIRKNDTAETGTGSNAGSDLDFRRYDDSGAAIDNVMTLYRGRGVLKLNRGLDLVTAAGGTVALTDAHTIYGVTSDAQTVTLPDATTCTGKILWVKMRVDGTCTITNATGAQTIDGALLQTITTNQTLHVYSNGSNWYILGKYTP
jgi:hypothetical protein